MYSSLVIHEHDLKIGIFKNKYEIKTYNSNFQIYKKGNTLNLMKIIIIHFIVKIVIKKI